MDLCYVVFVAFVLRLHLCVEAFAARDVELVTATVGQLQREQCDLFKGEWIVNPVGPAYTNESCEFIEPARDCITNGRPDTKYLYWKWKPYGCELPLFNAKKFLNSMQNKSWVFIGDSIIRNQLLSLLCLLSKAAEVVRDETFKSSIWHFPSHNFTLGAVWTPFLLKASDEAYNITVHLDILASRWTSQYNDYDYVVISSGHWFFKTAVFFENDTIIGCHHCSRANLPNLPELGSDFLYRKALQLAFRFILSSDHKPLVLFRTWTPDHFEFGRRSSGGVCNRTKPYKEGEFSGDDWDHLMRGVEIEEFEKAVAVGTQNGTRIRLLDTYHLSLLRPDGHPGPYYRFHPDLRTRTYNDCLHWCLPGTLEAWNDIVMEMVLNEGDLMYSS
ncbi:protein trichome birefringence-like 26 isoform X2 [Ananas comosus]|uniref:Protein trichome birefringence-like 26 isoform X2 n=1 Tax=Ananas comosus TaxID=4615 RepID=A0A6P5FQI5_ANACO|nr:protein trichome birefringence-like 26 isoform X2 [Ananas comosus]